MTLQQLIYFREVAETLHFKRAADRLFVAQSSLSHAVSTLENEIGVPLFVRQNGKKVFLSQYGEAFLPYVERIFKELREGQEHLEQMMQQKKGTVSIAYSFINGSNEISRLFQAFCAEPGNEEIQLHSFVNHGGSAFIEEHLMNGVADLALSCCAFAENRDIDRKRLYQQPLYLVLPAEHDLAGKQRLTLTDVKEESLLMMNGSLSLYHFVLDLYKEEDLKPEVANGISDWTALMDRIVCGQGISILPRIPFLEESVSFVPLKHRHHKRDVYLLWTKNRRLSPAAESFKTFCVSYFQNHKI